MFGGIIALALLAGAAFPLMGPPQDRGAIALIELVIVGLGFILYGSILAVEKEVVAVDDSLYYRRPGALFRRALVPKWVFDALYLLAFVAGLVRAVIQPRQTWPAVLWIGAGGMVGGLGIGLLVLLG